MSYVAFNTKGREEVRLRGSERAYMGVLITDMATSVVSRGLPSGWNRFLSIIPPTERERWTPLIQGPAGDSWIKTYLGALSEYDLLFNADTHSAYDTVANTIIAMESDVMSLMAKIHGTCELHGWFAPEDHRWAAEIMKRGLADHILRSDAGWEKVIALFEEDLDEPIVMSYSVTEGFPNSYISGYLGEMVEKWYEFDYDSQWELSMDGLKKLSYLQITPENLSKQGFMDGTTLWDAVESPEWKGEA